MQTLIDQYKNNGNIHHFHILIGEKENCRTQLKDFCEKSLNCETHGNPSFMEREFDRMLIDDVKEVVHRSFIKTESGSKMIFCISFNGITRESQNALLKVIEEPSVETYFFIIAPRKDIFIPTVLSRAVLIEVDSVQNPDTESGENIVTDFAKEILSDKKTVAEKLKVVEIIVKKIKDKKIEREVAREVVKKIIIELERDAVKNSTALKSLQKIDDYLADTGASVKLLLEKAVLSI